jgi:hypothetical protein
MQHITLVFLSLFLLQKLYLIPVGGVDDRPLCVGASCVLTESSGSNKAPAERLMLFKMFL